MVTILDTTLREGELQPGVYYTQEGRITIAKALAEIGTPRIEFPIIYPSRGGRREDVKAAVDVVQESYRDVTVIMHVRAVKGDVELARAYDTKGCAVYMAPTALHRDGKFHGIEQDTVIDKFVSVLDLMKDYGFSYRRATVEDASRFDITKSGEGEDSLEFLGKLLKAVEEAGATVVSIPDTSGILPQNLCGPFIESVKTFTKTPIACHFHNDYGNSLGNSLQAVVMPGVEEIHVSILGLGARNGITDHYEFVANLEDLYGIPTGEKRDKLRWLYNNFLQVSGIPLSKIHPLSPQCFMEKAGTHQSQVVKDPRGYIPCKKFELDAANEVLFEAGQFMSKRVVAKLFEGMETTSQVIEEVTNVIAARSALKRREIYPWEVKDIVEATSGLSLPLERINRVIRGSDYIYIMLSLIPQFSASSLVSEISKWSGVERVDEVYGDVDLIILTRMKDYKGSEIVDKIRERFKDAILKTITLPVE